MSGQNPTLLGVMGWPIGHSLSPLMHAHWIAELGLAGHYVPLPVAPENLGAALKGLAPLGFRGVNLTVPHKEAALPWMSEIDVYAKAIGAINTVRVGRDGTLTGHNTDALGYSDSMEQAGVRAGNGLAIVLGAGGAARAIVRALPSLGFKHIVLANRNRARAEALAASPVCPDIEVVDWERALARGDEAQLLVNTTSLGMVGQPPLDLALDALNPDAWVSDIVYRPLQTPLLERARARGHKTVDGLGMLLHQGAHAFGIWFGQIPPVTQNLRGKLLHALGEV